MRPAHLVTCFVLSGCTASAEQVAPPRYDFYFPTGMALSPDEKYLYVINANSDLRYSSGSLQAIDLDALDSMIEAGATANGCAALPARPTVLGCPSSNDDGAPSPAMVADASVEIGNFGVNLAVQPLLDQGAASSMLRLFATVRGDPSLTWVDFDASAGTMDCGGSGAFPRCDEPHRLARIRDDATLPVLPIEPFDVAVDPLRGHVFVTHLTTGQVTLGSAPSEVGSTPLLEDINSVLWGLNRLDGSLGAVGIAPRLPNDPRGLVYVTSRSEARVAMVHAAGERPAEALVRTGSFLYSGLVDSGLPGDARNLVFSADGNRAYFVQRSPASLQVFDTSLDSAGQPVNRFIGAVEVCNQPSNLAVVDFGEGPRAVVPCFSTGQVWIIDPIQLSVVAVEDTGRGPNGVAASAKRKKIYVGNYAEDTLMIIDATPGAASQYRAILRFGRIRRSGQS